MNGPWIPLLLNLPLSRTEREVVRRFEADPLGRTFLPIADILRSHRLLDESLELLSQGVERHPTFAVARVVLARELLQKGMVEPAWRTLESSPVPLRENILAQKLRLRLAVLLGMEAQAKATAQHMLLHQMVDADAKRIIDVMDVTGFADARSKLMQEAEAKGTTLVLPTAETSQSASSSPSSSQASAGSTMQEPSRAPSPEAREAEIRLAAVEARLAEADEPSLAGFHVVPLDEIFRPSSGTEPGDSARARGAEGVELDSTTLADIYARQGHYSKALVVYRRLLRMAPHNELLRRKVAELVKLEREQKDVDLTVDPSVVDRMESVEIIDRQIRFYNDLLSRLS